MVVNMIGGKSWKIDDYYVGFFASINNILDQKKNKLFNEIQIDLIDLNPFQPRTNFNSNELEQLTSSIEKLGLIQPITVKKNENRYTLISGERRLRAFQKLSKKSIPAYIRLANDQESLEMALVENIQRKNLDPIEIAISYSRLTEELKISHDEMSKRVGKDRTTITNYIRLLKLDPIIQSGLRDNFISMGTVISKNTDHDGLYRGNPAEKHKLSAKRFCKIK